VPHLRTAFTFTGLAEPTAITSRADMAEGVAGRDHSRVEFTHIIAMHAKRAKQNDTVWSYYGVV
jgi:hypothetical protein